MAQVFIASCPVCGAEINLTDPVVREVVECSDCGTELEVVEINNDKIVLAEAELEGEDWGQ